MSRHAMPTRNRHNTTASECVSNCIALLHSSTAVPPQGGREQNTLVRTLPNTALSPAQPSGTEENRQTHTHTQAHCHTHTQMQHHATQNRHNITAQAGGPQHNRAKKRGNGAGGKKKGAHFGASRSRSGEKNKKTRPELAARSNATDGSGEPPTQPLRGACARTTVAC